MKILIRPEEECDIKEVENMTREAFWDLYKPGCVEHLIVHNMRRSSDFVKELDHVACDGDKIIGSIIYSKAKVINNENKEFEVLCMGPLGVLPSYQNKGVGSLLMEHSIEKAKHLGYKAIIIFGNPEYYKRFGFKNATEYNIQTSSGENFEAFMTLELYDESLDTISGKFYASDSFEINEEDLDNFDKGFTPKEKHVLDTQLF
ncbi:GNAT family N-acetyltransferase [Methanococcoides sp. AM1]|uniref:GNAT family N-acetyltransferase n=1 Tax=Methanococcoides sp. AM1 TaxID=1201011 RepID=UPI001082476B|nr:N-acetyltransferase [Methanococcoides sp. AM1]